MSILSTVYNAGRSVVIMVMYVLRHLAQASYEYGERMHDFDFYAEIQDGSEEEDNDDDGDDGDADTMY